MELFIAFSCKVSRKATTNSARRHSATELSSPSEVSSAQVNTSASKGYDASEISQTSISKKITIHHKV